jgi:hypothetical protein
MSAGVLNLYSLARIGEKRSTAWALYLSDGLGAIRQATEGDGAVTSSRRWTPFGPALSPSTPLGMNSVEGEDGGRITKAAESRVGFGTAQIMGKSKITTL